MITSRERRTISRARPAGADRGSTRSRSRRRAWRPRIPRARARAGCDRRSPRSRTSRSRRRVMRRARRSRQRRSSSSGGRKRPSARRLALKGWFTAPGMWPATGSIGSTAPAKRSGARASMSRVPGFRSAAISSSAPSTARRSTCTAAAGAARGLPGRVQRLAGLQGAPCAQPRAHAAVEHGDLVMPEPAQQPPRPRGERAVRLVVDDRLGIRA